MAGHKCVGHCEWDKFANASYKAMHNPKEDEWFGNDIRDTRANELPRADAWCFGFPCQDISISVQGGRFTGFNGERSSLFFTVMQLLQDKEREDRPKYLFIENVRNLLSVNKGCDFLKLLIELDKCGYNAEWQIINSKHHGVAQNRPRLYIVGHNRKSETGSVFPISKATDGFLKSIQADTSGKGLNSQQDRFYMTDGIMCCLPKARAKTKCCVCDYDGNLHILTARERMRLQGFPDEYTDRALEVTSENDLCEQAGNSVTVNVIYEIAKRLG